MEVLPALSVAPPQSVDADEPQREVWPEPGVTDDWLLMAKESTPIELGEAESPESVRVAVVVDVPAAVCAVPKLLVCAAPEYERLPATAAVLADSVTVTVPLFVDGVPSTAAQISARRSAPLPELPQLPVALPLEPTATRQVKVGLVPLQVTLVTRAVPLTATGTRSTTLVALLPTVCVHVMLVPVVMV